MSVIVMHTHEIMQYGVNETFVLDVLRNSIRANAAHKVNEFEGEYWCRLSVKTVQERLPFMSEKTVQRALNSLVKQNVIKKACLGEKMDRTSWYTLV